MSEKFIKRGIKECESTHCFRKYEIKYWDPSIFREMRKQKLQALI